MKVEWKKLGEVCEILDSQRKPVSKDKRIQGKYPYYGANGIQDYVDDYIFDGTFLLMGEDGSVINKDNSPVLHWITGRAWVNNHAHILKEVESVLLRYLYYALQCADVSEIVRGVPPKLNQANMRNILIPVPPPSEQERIVGILDTFTAAIDNLKGQIAQRRKQFEHYRDELLDLEGKEGVEMKTLGDLILSLKTGLNPRQNFKLNTTNSKIPYITGKDIFNNRINVTEKTDKIDEEALTIINKRACLENDLLLFASTGCGTVGRMAVIDKYNNNWGISETLYALKTKEEIIPKFLMFFLYSREALRQYEPKISRGSVPHLKVADLLKIKIPLPPLSTQSRIVSILDTFEASISNLEAQLKEREKQYEYYRNQLLTFE